MSDQQGDPITALIEGMVQDGVLTPEQAEAILAGGGGGQTDPFASDISDFTVAESGPIMHRSADAIQGRINANKPAGRGVLTREEQARRGMPTEEEVAQAQRPTLDPNRPKRLGDLLKEFYLLNEQDLLNLQKHLFAGGFYGDRGIQDIAWGEHGEDSFAAYAGALERAARFYGAGKKDITYWDVIRMASEEGAGMRSEGVTGPDGSGTRVLGGGSVNLSDPAGLRLTLDETSRAILGRRANVEEQRMFVALIHRMQREAAGGAEVSVDEAGHLNLEDLDQIIADVRAGVYGSGVGANDQALANVSPEAQAYEFAIQENPEEFAGQQVLEQTTAAEDLIFNPRRLPSVGGG